MKNILIQSAYIIFVSILLLSCDESFNPKTEFEEGYSLFCVIDGNSAYQTAYITKNYNPADLNPENYTEDKSISGAEITLTCSDTVYKFRDTVLISSETGKSYSAYYIKDFKIQDGTTYLSAKLDGTDEISGSIFHRSEELSLAYLAARDIVYYPRGDYEISFDNHPEPFYFMPSLYINYVVRQNSVDSAYTIEVPKSINNNGSNEVLFFPDLVFRNGYNYSIENIERTLRHITEISPPNSIIIIRNLTLEILEISEALAAYYLVNKTYNDGYTIKNQGPTYSYVKGGNGLVGFKFAQKFRIKFHPNWQTPIINMGYIFER